MVVLGFGEDGHKVCPLHQKSCSVFVLEPRMYVCLNFFSLCVLIGRNIPKRRVAVFMNQLRERVPSGHSAMSSHDNEGEEVTSLVSSRGITILAYLTYMHNENDLESFLLKDYVTLYHITTSLRSCMYTYIHVCTDYA